MPNREQTFLNEKTLDDCAQCVGLLIKKTFYSLPFDSKIPQVHMPFQAIKSFYDECLAFTFKDFMYLNNHWNCLKRWGKFERYIFMSCLTLLLHNMKTENVLN